MNFYHSQMSLFHRILNLVSYSKRRKTPESRVQDRRNNPEDTEVYLKILSRKDLQDISSFLDECLSGNIGFSLRIIEYYPNRNFKKTVLVYKFLLEMSLLSRLTYSIMIGMIIDAVVDSM